MDYSELIKGLHSLKQLPPGNPVIIVPRVLGPRWTYCDNFDDEEQIPRQSSEEN